ncbi:MAG: DUF4911 domain-containing protein [Desulfovibrionaceae bacterium]
MAESEQPSPPKRRVRKRKPRPRPPLAPPPERSARLYVRVAPADVALFRYLLEAHDNLALFTVVDRLAAVLMLRFGPEQEPEVRAFLEEVSGELAVDILPLPVR